MSTGPTPPGHEMDASATSTAAALAAAASEPVAWAPPAPAEMPQPTSFNPRVGMPRPSPVQSYGAPQVPVTQAPMPPVPQAYAPQAYAAPSMPQPNYGQPDYGYGDPNAAEYSQPDYGQLDYGMPDYAATPPGSFASMAQAPAPDPQSWGPPPAHPSTMGQPDPYGAPTYADAPATPDEAPAKTSLLSRFKRKPKAAKGSSGGVMVPPVQPQPAESAQITAPTNSASAGKPFMMGVLTGIIMMLGVGFLIGGEPDPIPARYAPSPTADAQGLADAPLAFVDVEEGPASQQ